MRQNGDTRVLPAWLSACYVCEIVRRVRENGDTRVVLSQYNSTGTESGNGGQFKREMIVAIFAKYKIGIERRTRTTFFHRSSTLKIKENVYPR